MPQNENWNKEREYRKCYEGKLKQLSGHLSSLSLRVESNLGTFMVSSLLGDFEDG